MIVYGDDTSLNITVYSVDVTTGTATSLGSGTVGTLLDITDHNGLATIYLMIRVDVAATTTNTIYGGVLYIDDSGSVPSTFNLTPKDFLVNDDT